MGSSEFASEQEVPEINEGSTIPELIGLVLSSSREKDFKLVERILISREEDLKIQLKKEQQERSLLQKIHGESELDKLEMQEEIKKLKREKQEAEEKAVAGAMGIDVSEIGACCAYNTSEDDLQREGNGNLDCEQNVENASNHREKPQSSYGARSPQNGPSFKPISSHQEKQSNYYPCTASTSINRICDKEFHDEGQLVLENSTEVVPCDRPQSPISVDSIESDDEAPRDENPYVLNACGSKVNSSKKGAAFMESGRNGCPAQTKDLKHLMPKRKRSLIGSDDGDSCPVSMRKKKPVGELLHDGNDSIINNCSVNLDLHQSRTDIEAYVESMARVPIHMHPGPVDAFVLSRQGEHCSSLIWDGEEPSLTHALLFRRCDGKFWDAYLRADRRVLDVIDLAGFGGVCRVGNISVDHSLITAMVERWRPETHTFHLPVGEATITLQDVAVLWGLRADGDPIIGGCFGSSVSEWQDMCERLLGFRPLVDDIKGNKLFARSIESFLAAPLPEEAGDVEVAQRARGLLLMLFGGLLFSDKSGNKVPLRFLPLLDDLHRCGTLSWGSGVLAFLYRGLCNAARGSAREICGPMVLLQLWVYEHLPILRPIRAQPCDELPDLAPYGARWNRPFDLGRVATHVLVAYRDQLDALCTDQFIWLPYKSILQMLPPTYLEGSDIWRSTNVPLICWEIIEMYFPNRVMRQFGDEQLIPETHDIRWTQHNVGLRGVSTRNWASYHRDFVQEWSQKRERVVTGQPTISVVVPRPDYMNWYLLRTRILIGNPANRPEQPEGYQRTGSVAQTLASACRTAIGMVDYAMPHVDPHSRTVFAKLREILDQAISHVGSLGCHRQTDAASADVQPSTHRPQAKIAARGQRGVRRGGRRPRAVRANAARDAPSELEAFPENPDEDQVVSSEPPATDIMRH